MVELSREQRYFWLGFAVLFVGTLLLRSYGIAEISTWMDEANTAYQVQESPAEIVAHYAENQNPPLYYLVLKPWVQLFGIGPLGLRSFSLVFSMLALGVWVLLLRRYLNWQMALLGGLFFALGDVHLYFAQEGRNYAFSTFWMLCSAGLFFRTAERTHWLPPVALGVVNALLLYTHFTTGLLLLTEAAVALVLLRFRPRAFRPLLLSALLSLAIFLPWVPNFLSNLPDATTDWRTPPSADVVWLTWARVLGSKPLGILGLVLAFAGGPWLIWQLRRQGTPPAAQPFPRWLVVLFFNVLAVLPVVAIVTTAYTVSPVFNWRYVFVVSFGGYAVLAALVWQLYRMGSARWQLALAGVLLLGWLGAAVAGLHVPPRKEEDWKGAAAVLAPWLENPRVGIITSSDYIAQPFTYHYNRDWYAPGTLEDSLLAHKVFPAKTTTDLPPQALRCCDTLVLLQAHHLITDPRQRIPDTLRTLGYRNVYFSDSLRHIQWGLWVR